MEHRIEPIEKPNGIKMRLGFYFLKDIRQGDHQQRPFYSRVPGIMFVAKKFNDVEEGLSLDPTRAKLIKHHVASTNGCHLCIDINMRNAMDKKL